MKILLFTGAGASVELGVPAMRRMAEQFRDHLHDIDLPSEVLSKMDALVANPSHDMEHAIDIIDKKEAGFKADQELGEHPDEAEILPYRTIRQEAEWFVQHCCEQIRSDAAIRMWSPVLRSASNIDLIIVTTNYDRAIEIAAARLSTELEDGFTSFSGKEYAEWRDIEDNADIKLLKMHGSTDWYRTKDDRVFKLRHPMPLFGGLQIIPGEPADQSLNSALVLPSREKLANLFPFPSINSEFRQRAKDVDAAIFVGSSLRDPHMRDVCISCAKSKPTYVVSRSGHFEEGVVPENAMVIRQGAGRFLVSTLSEFLRTQDESVLNNASETQDEDTSAVIEWLGIANDKNRDSMERCSAIEALADQNISLQHQEIGALLESDNSEVSTFALGLILSSGDQASLIKSAKAVAEEKADSQFSAEVNTLLKLIETA